MAFAPVLGLHLVALWQGGVGFGICLLRDMKQIQLACLPSKQAKGRL